MTLEQLAKIDDNSKNYGVKNCEDRVIKVNILQINNVTFTNILYTDQNSNSFRYTGMKDFFNEELFEGDIFQRHALSDNNAKEFYVIFMNKGSWSYMQSSEKANIGFLYDIHEQIKKVGTISQDSHLVNMNLFKNYF